MQSGSRWRARGALRRVACRVCGVGSLLAMLFAVAACTTDGTTTGSLAQPPAGTIAFESIDGPPPEVFHAFVRAIADEAKKRQVAVVSREGPANYRVRGYLSALIRPGKTSIAWAWDLYDANQERVLRLAGEVPAAGPSREAWKAANDQVLRKIAQSGLEQVAGYVGAGDATGTTDSGAPVAVAGADDFRPEAAGIFRMFNGSDTAANETDGAAPPATVPLPRRRPTRAMRASAQQTLAFAPAGAQ